MPNFLRRLQRGAIRSPCPPPGQPNVNGTVTVSRDAPALFQQQNSQNLPLVLATHQDGSPITLTSPAVHGETITIYGTGFGPYNQTIADGFATPSSPVFGVTDPVSVRAGSASLTPASVAAAPGMVGIVGMQVAIAKRRCDELTTQPYGHG